LTQKIGNSTLEVDKKRKNLESKSRIEKLKNRQQSKTKVVPNKILDIKNSTKKETVLRNFNYNTTLKNVIINLNKQTSAKLNFTNKSNEFHKKKLNSTNNYFEINYRKIPNNTNKEKVIFDEICTNNTKQETSLILDKKPNSTKIDMDLILNGSTKFNDKNHLIKNSTNNSKIDLKENYNFENYTDSEINSEIINNKINSEFNITDNDSYNFNYNITLPNLISLNSSDSNNKSKNSENSTINNFMHSTSYKIQDLEKNKNKDKNPESIKSDSGKNNTIENFSFSVFSNNNIFEDRNFELYLLNKKKENHTYPYLSDVIDNNDSYNNYEIENESEKLQDDLSEKFKIYLENTKKRKEFINKGKSLNNFLNNNTNISFLEDNKNQTNMKIENLNNSFFLRDDSESDFNETLNINLNLTKNELISFKNKSTVSVDYKKKIVKPRKLITTGNNSENINLSTIINPNNENKNINPSFYDSNFLAYESNKKKNNNIDNSSSIHKKAEEENSEKDKNLTESDNNPKVKNSKDKEIVANKNLKDIIKNHEGRFVNIIFSLILITLLLAGLCGLIFLMFIKTNSK